MGGLGLRNILPIIGVLHNVNRRQKSMGASQAKLCYAFTRAVCSYAITVSAIQICKNKNYEVTLNALLLKQNVVREVYAAINVVHDLRLKYSSLCPHCVST